MISFSIFLNLLSHTSTGHVCFLAPWKHVFHCSNSLSKNVWMNEKSCDWSIGSVTTAWRKQCLLPYVALASTCTYITRMDVMLDFICMGPVDLTGVRRKRQNTKWKIPCPQWDSSSQPFDSKSDALPTELAGLGECCTFKWPYYIHVLPIPMLTLLYVPEWWSRA